MDVASVGKLYGAYSIVIVKFKIENYQDDIITNELEVTFVVMMQQ